MFSPKSKFRACGVLLLAALALAGCGKRATHVDPPTEAGKAFPFVYPDPNTDPKPDNAP